MQVEQIATLVNDISAEVFGEDAITTEDLSNVVDLGNAFANLGSAAYDNFVRSLIDHIGKVVFVNRVYDGGAPSVLMDAWQYGSIAEKIKGEIPEAQQNDTWNLQDGYVYEQDTFHKPQASAKFYDKKTTFETPMSFAQRQVRSAFDNATQINAFFSMIETNIYNGETVKTDALIMRLINTAIANTINSEFAGGSGYDASTGVRAVNLLYLYNQQHEGSEITSLQEAMCSPEFIRFASFTMGIYKSRLRKISTLFNIGGQKRFTPNDRLHFVMLDDFVQAANVFNQSDTFHNELTRLPNAETVPYWQGSGLAYDIDDVSSIDVTVPTGSGVDANINVSGIIGVMFDRDALGVCNMDRRVTTHYNARAEFYNNWYKVDSHYFLDTDENIVVFYAAYSS